MERPGWLRLTRSWATEPGGEASSIIAEPMCGDLWRFCEVNSRRNRLACDTIRARLNYPRVTPQSVTHVVRQLCYILIRLFIHGPLALKTFDPRAPRPDLSADVGAAQLYKKPMTWISQHWIRTPQIREQHFPPTA